MKTKSNSILITGVSTGIGYGVAQEFINRGYTVFGSVGKKKMQLACTLNGAINSSPYFLM